MADNAIAEEVEDNSALSELEAFFDDEDAVVPESDTTEVEEEESEAEVEEPEDETEEEVIPDDTTEESEPETKPVKKEESTEEETDESGEEEDTTSESDEKPDEKSQKELAHEAFKRREAERKLREAEQKQEQANIQRYLDEAKDDEEELAKRQLDVNTYTLNKERSAVLQEKLDVSMQKAVLELGLKSMDKATTDYIGRRLDEFEATRVLKDQRGNVVEVRGDVYQYLKEEMDSIQSFRSSGAREQTKKKAVEKTRTVLKPTRTPKEAPADDGMDAFAEEANRY